MQVLGEAGRPELEIKIKSILCVKDYRSQSFIDLLNQSKSQNSLELSLGKDDFTKDISESSEFLDQHNELAQKLSNIKVNEKVQVMFNLNDPIFSL